MLQLSSLTANCNFVFFNSQTRKLIERRIINYICSNSNGVGSFLGAHPTNAYRSPGHLSSNQENLFLNKRIGMEKTFQFPLKKNQFRVWINRNNSGVS